MIHVVDDTWRGYFWAADDFLSNKNEVCKRSKRARIFGISALIEINVFPVYICKSSKVLSFSANFSRCHPSHGE